jgi:superfamily II DNA helicase RecQ
MRSNRFEENPARRKNSILFLAQYLLAHNIHALSYHAGLNDSLRQTIHMRWIDDECQVKILDDLEF